MEFRSLIGRKIIYYIAFLFTLLTAGRNVLRWFAFDIRPKQWNILEARQKPVISYVDYFLLINNCGFKRFKIPTASLGIQIPVRAYSLVLLPNRRLSNENQKRNNNNTANVSLPQNSRTAAVYLHCPRKPMRS